MSEDLSYANEVKYELSLEQGKWKVEEINTHRPKKVTDRVSHLEEQIRPFHTSRVQVCYDSGRKEISGTQSHVGKRKDRAGASR